MKRKTFSWLLTLSLVLCLILSGCGGSQDATKPADQGSAVQQDSSPPATPPVTEGNDTPEPSDPKETVDEPSSLSDEIGDRLAKTYTDMMASDKYFMKYRMTTDGESIETEMAYMGDDLATRTLVNGVESRMIIKDNKVYMIDPVEKIIMIINSDDYEQEEEIDYAGLAYVGEGKGDFLGETFHYEEYSADGGTTKYFFDGKKLVGIESSYEDMNIAMEVLELSKKIPADLFEIPQDYEQQNLGE
ncbi:hypothetical protein Desdi_0213 [Desulfitobacterium dichloroeliminans LMG P-21439]|uniref:DUF4412 domain-containing protein n=1 Tax=Desulfitobacterium dichloroeliminans (strain LMG P-21439 / DCA1) TaxID=871963 RepID=L0F3K9_DESDL|nr:hypothetical protein [Desulfitobacterium dichloroeliminans]AGA67767.1 hypothetical protein Desdi_0213 [Desulfitobacterium dichloroeliminans LMG P-21439]